MSLGITIGGYPASFTVSPGDQLDFYVIVGNLGDAGQYYEMLLSPAMKWQQSADGEWALVQAPSAVEWVTDVSPGEFGLPADGPGFYPPQDSPYAGTLADIPEQFVHVFMDVPPVPPGEYRLTLTAKSLPGSEGNVRVAAGMTYKFTVR